MNKLIVFLTQLKKDFIWFSAATDKSMKTLAEISIHNRLQTLKTSIERGNFTKEYLFDCARVVGLIR